MKREKLRIFLTGGLGNQLFQLAAGLYFRNSRQLELDLSTANPRRNSLGNPEILTLNLPQDVKLLKQNQGPFVRRIFGFSLRSGYSPRRGETNLGSRILLKSITNSLLSLFLKKKFQVSVSRNLGNDSKLKPIFGSQILIGYFQTHLFTNELIKIKNELFSNVCQSEYVKFKLLATKENPLLVHIRLGDYTSEDTFGVLSDSYYESAINYAWQMNSYGKIWLFSDDPQAALSKIPDDYRKFTRTIPAEHLESAETLRIMTLCKGYVIANSTFSWWAASLRETENVLVIAPQPWFKVLAEPTDLIPPNWLRMKGF
jgi:hypothetical protein